MSSNVEKAALVHVEGMKASGVQPLHFIRQSSELVYDIKWLTGLREQEERRVVEY